MLLWNTLVDWSDLIVLAVMYVIAGFGVTVGFHRMLTHRVLPDVQVGCSTCSPIAGSMAVQGPVISWVADHRKHHAHTDEEGDPHSPHGHGSGFKGAVKGLWYAHMGWLFDRQGQAAYRKYAKDLVEDRGHSAGSTALFPLWVAARHRDPGGARLRDRRARSPRPPPARCGAASCASSCCTTSRGRSTPSATSSARAASTSRTTRPTCSGSPRSRFGESWHHNHHAFPRSAVHGLKWYEIDPSAWVIRAMKATKLAWNVVEISPERQQQKLAPPREREDRHAA